MRTLAIGDIHGSCTALLALLDEVKPQPDDQLVFLTGQSCSPDSARR